MYRTQELNWLPRRSTEVLYFPTRQKAMGRVKTVFYSITWLLVLILFAWWVGLVAGILHCLVSPQCCLLQMLQVSDGRPGQRSTAALPHLHLHDGRLVFQVRHHNMLLQVLQGSLELGRELPTVLNTNYRLYRFCTIL